MRCTRGSRHSSLEKSTSTASTVQPKRCTSAGTKCDPTKPPAPSTAMRFDLMSQLLATLLTSTRNEDVGPAIVCRVVGQTHRALERSPHLPQIDLVVGDVVIVAALRDAPHHPFAVGGQLRKVLVRATPREVHELELVAVELLRRFALGDRHAVDFAA